MDNSDCIPRSSFVPVTREESLRNDCEPVETKTAGIGDYVLTVTNPNPIQGGEENLI
jgi:hypothetical protein